MGVFRLFEKLRCSNERSAKFESLYHEQKYLEEENGKIIALQMSPRIESLNRPYAKMAAIKLFFCSYSK